MDPRLSKLISHYQETVRQAVELMQASGIKRPATNREWAGLDMPQRGELSGGVRYFKHGFGCAVHLPDGCVDFDFGADGEIDGFDAWRLTGFLNGRLVQYGFVSEAELQELFCTATKADDIQRSGYLLYYLKTP